MDESALGNSDKRGFWRPNKKLNYKHLRNQLYLLYLLRFYFLYMKIIQELRNIKISMVKCGRL